MIWQPNNKLRLNGPNSFTIFRTYTGYQDLPDHQALPELLEHLVLRDKLELPVMPPLHLSPVHLEHQVHQDPLVQLDP